MDITTIIENLDRAISELEEAQSAADRAADEANCAESEADRATNSQYESESVLTSIEVDPDDFVPDDEVFEDEDFDPKEVLREALHEMAGEVESLVENASYEIEDISQYAGDARQAAEDAATLAREAEAQIDNALDVLRDLKKSVAGDTSDAFKALQDENKTLKEENEALRAALAEMRRASRHVAKRLELDAARP